MSDKLDIFNEMKQFDLKNRLFYDQLSDDERKKFSGYLMIRWGSTVSKCDAELAEYYIVSTNHYLNTNFFAINKHPKLQWLCASAVSPGVGVKYHQWISPAKNEPKANSNEIRKFLMAKYPEMKMADIETLCHFTTKKDITEYARLTGKEE